tara:strand:+ start:1388 stop:1786 length:399 start_codon:yes stop_codon:yes gene_type:complete
MHGPKPHAFPYLTAVEELSRFLRGYQLAHRLFDLYQLQSQHLSETTIGTFEIDYHLCQIQPNCVHKETKSGGVCDLYCKNFHPYTPTRATPTLPFAKLPTIPMRSEKYQLASDHFQEFDHRVSHPSPTGIPA